MQNNITDVGMAVRPKKYTGEYIGTVKAVDTDPKKGCRVYVEIDPIFTGVPVASLPPVTYKLPLGCRPNDGSFIPLQVGDRVWCDFPYDGDTRRPRVTGVVHEIPEDGNPSLPSDASGGNGRLDQDAGYHEDAVVAKQHDGIIKLRKNGEILIQQISSGTTVRIEKGGTISISCCKAQTQAGPKAAKSVLIEVADPEGVLCYRARTIATYCDVAIGGTYEECPENLRASTKGE